MNSLALFLNFQDKSSIYLLGLDSGFSNFCLAWKENSVLALHLCFISMANGSLKGNEKCLLGETPQNSNFLSSIFVVMVPVKYCFHSDLH